MTSYAGVYEFNDRGMLAFRKIFLGELDENAISPTDRQFATRVPGTGPIDDSPATSAKELAQRVLTSLGDNYAALLPRAGVWAWLTFALRDTVVPKDKSGKRVPGELHRWWPSDPGDWQKAQRHLVRMPVVLLAELGDAVDHLICGSPDVLPDIREQLTSQQDMFHPEFQKAARQLYFDSSKGTLKRGSGSKGAGTPRRLAKLRSQLDVTWNLFDLDADHIVSLLPKEFNRFKPAVSQLEDA
jgi:hypothetical protein